MKFIVTCGPSYEPIDEVRRLTNFSTGQLGTELTNSFVERGHEVVCFRAEGSTFCGKNQATQLIHFSTAFDLAQKLKQVASPDSIHAIFHTAAIGDYQVASIQTSQGEEIRSKKIATNLGEILLRLKPTIKIISFLRSMFPKAFLVGWKYEVEGSREAVLEKGRKQIESYQTDACVINGPALNKKMMLCLRSQKTYHILERETLVQKLLEVI